MDILKINLLKFIDELLDFISKIKYNGSKARWISEFINFVYNNFRVKINFQMQNPDGVVPKNPGNVLFYV